MGDCGRRFTYEEKRQIALMHADGKTQAEIVRALQASESSIRGQLQLQQFAAAREQPVERPRFGTSSHGWTPDRVAALRTMAESGMGATRIAEALGGGLTKNAVIGKANREGIALAGSPRPPNKGVKTGPRPKTPPGWRAPASLPDKGEPRVKHVPFVSAPEALEPIAGSALVTIADLRKGLCHWPLGDTSDIESFRYCGVGCAVSVRYCEHHTKLAYRPAADQRRSTGGLTAFPRTSTKSRFSGSFV